MVAILGVYRDFYKIIFCRFIFYQCLYNSKGGNKMNYVKKCPECGSINLFINKAAVSNSKY